MHVTQFPWEIGRSPAVQGPPKMQAFHASHGLGGQVLLSWQGHDARPPRITDSVACGAMMAGWPNHHLAGDGHPSWGASFLRKDACKAVPNENRCFHSGSPWLACFSCRKMAIKQPFMVVCMTT